LSTVELPSCAGAASGTPHLIICPYSRFVPATATTKSTTRCYSFQYSVAARQFMMRSFIEAVNQCVHMNCFINSIRRSHYTRRAKNGYEEGSSSLVGEQLHFWEFIYTSVVRSLTGVMVSRNENIFTIQTLTPRSCTRQPRDITHASLPLSCYCLQTSTPPDSLASLLCGAIG
jgi:hypothetical protein